MKVTKEKNGEELTVFIEGAVDTKTAPLLRQEMEGELDDVTRVIFDLKDTDYTSSAGLRVFLGTYQTLEGKDGSMVLRHVSDEFMEILEMTGFTDFLEIER